MTQQTINVGTTANDGTGDPLRTAYTKANSNFTELYTSLAGLVVGTVSEFFSNAASRLLNVATFWSALTPVTVTYAASVTLDMSSGVNFNIALTGNLTLANPTNQKVGQAGRIRLTQDATGSRTITFGTNWKTAGGTAGALTTTANAVDLLYYEITASNEITYSLLKDVR